MKMLGLFEAKNKLSEVCQMVATRHEPVVVTRHGKPLVRIVPYDDPKEEGSVWGSLEDCRVRFGTLTDSFELPAREIAGNRGDPLS